MGSPYLQRIDRLRRSIAGLVEVPLDGWVTGKEADRLAEQLEKLRRTVDNRRAGAEKKSEESSDGVSPA